jgi:hypothetical protein
MPTRFQQRFRRRLFLTAGLAALLLFSFAACDSSGDDEDEVDLPEDTFEATVSGDVSAELSGKARYRIRAEDEPQPDEPEKVFQLYMTSEDDTTRILLSRPAVTGRPQTADVPDEGTYDLFDGKEAENSGQPPPEGTFGVFIFILEPETGFLSRSGTLIITHSGGDRLAGTLQLQGGETTLIGPPPPNPNEISVEGRFNATRTEEPLPSQNADASSQAAR